MTKWVYNFGQITTEGNKNDNYLLGNKGANLAQMSLIGIPVPPGFTLTTELCNYYFKHARSFPDDLKNQIEVSLSKIENQLGLKFGDPTKPLLLSIRSGAMVSMPGMMDTILNLGLNDITVEALAKLTNNPRFAYDCYRRFIQMYSEIVLGVEHYVFENLLHLKKQDANIHKDSELSLDDLKDLIAKFKNIVFEEVGKEFPQDIYTQLWEAIKSVIESWMNVRAIRYRRIHHFDDSLGTAVNIQSMVFGNMDENSATGVAFTRDPSTGKKVVFGEYLINAQGEDVVAGIRTPQVISKSAKPNIGINVPSLEEYMPAVYKELVGIFDKLENFYQDMQDIEFTIEQGKIWILQTRSGKRSALAGLKIAFDMVEEGIITKEQALLNINPDSLEKLLHPTIDNQQNYFVMAKGLPASPGAATGRVYFDADTTELKSKTEDVILVRTETSPEDIHGMNAAKGILTIKGGMTSHAAVVARGMGKPCICGAGSISVNYDLKQFIAGDQFINEGDVITINGSTGDVILGEVKTILPELPDEFFQIMQWANENKNLDVRANAETISDAKAALQFGAVGIGLCRTEHMFFNTERISVVREMILSEDEDGRKKALNKLLAMQVADFVEIFEIMGSLPINIRLLDPPLHEFLPHTEKEKKELAETLNLSIHQINSRISQLTEHNPMLGHRGCRIGISFPEIYEMQANAIFQAMKLNFQKLGKAMNIEIMIPFVISIEEIKRIKTVIENAYKIEYPESKEYPFLVGTMIELPRACMIADQLAQEAQFFSFGTNDLTQTTLGLSRDDSASFMNTYINSNIFQKDPFVEMDQDGVGGLIKIAIEKGIKSNPHLKLGICGEHAGDPKTIKFCDSVGLHYISCSPFRVPIAILSAAQARIQNRK